MVCENSNFNSFYIRVGWLTGCFVAAAAAAADHVQITISEICRMFPAVPPLNRGEKNVSAYISANFFFFFVFIPFVLLWKKKKNAYKICVYNIYHHCCIEYARPCCVAPQTTMTTVAICAKWKSGAAVAGESGYIIRLRNAINV